ncbi:hypothetical protein A9996_18865, partial [Gelidibacter algens]
VITGIFSLMYVPSNLIVWDNSTVTFNNIFEHQTLFRMGLLGYIICYITFLFLPLVLYKLLKPINHKYALLMVALAVVSVPMALINIQNQYNVLSVMSGENYLKIFSNEQIQAQVLLYLNHYDNGHLITSVFFGLWLFPFGYLVYKSGFIPKIFGIFLMLGCFSYLINFIGNTLFVNYPSLGIASYIQIPASIGEIGICLWLLIIGTKQKRVD